MSWKNNFIVQVELRILIVGCRSSAQPRLDSALFLTFMYSVGVV